MNAPNPLDLQHSYAEQLEGLYAPVEPEGFPSPSLLMLNRPLAEALGLDPTALEAHGAQWLSGAQVPPGARPIAQAYAGHQFGSFNPQLGDGRALLLGEVIDPGGRRHDLQLKGSGLTPFSRRGDGRAALDSALREYILSEAMQALGIPTTRSLAVVTTGETLARRGGLPGAVLTRVAGSHLRVGTLEYFASRRQHEQLRRLVDYALTRHYPEHRDAERPAQALLEAVAEAQGQLVARWMMVGFIHGVMNTDNVALSGETIDYGPAAFMDVYDPRTAFSQIDHHGRYAYGNQPTIGAWNLARMAEALLELLHDDEREATRIAQASLERYGKAIADTWVEGMGAKLGLEEPSREDGDLFQSLLDAMHTEKVDYTSTFRGLADGLAAGTSPFQQPAGTEWTERWIQRLAGADRTRAAARMNATNPIYIPRNHKVEEALEAAVEGDLAPTQALLEVLQRPFERQPGREDYADPAPEAFGPYQTHCNT